MAEKTLGKKNPNKFKLVDFLSFQSKTTSTWHSAICTQLSMKGKFIWFFTVNKIEVMSGLLNKVQGISQQRVISNSALVSI